MKNRTRMMYVLLLALCTQSVIAQGGKIGASFYRPKQVLKAGPIAGKTLLIAPYELDKRKAKKLEKAGKMKEKLADMEASSQRFYELIKEKWTQGEVLRGSIGEVTEAEKNKDVLVIKPALRKDVHTKTNSLTKTKKTFRFSYYAMEVYSEGKLVAWFTNTGGNLTDLDIQVGLNLIEQEWLAAMEEIKNDGFDEFINKNAGELKTKTLLIPQGVTTMTEEDLKDKYPHALKLVSLEEIIEKIKSGSKNHLFYLPYHDIGSCGSRFMHIVYRCDDFMPVALVKGNAVQFGDFSGHAPGKFEILSLLELLPGSTEVPMTKLLKKGDLSKLGKL